MCTRSLVGSRGASREDRAAGPTVAEPEQNRRASRAARAERRSPGGVLSSGADLENARGKYRGREAKGGLPLGSTGASRAHAQLGYRAPLLERTVRTGCTRFAPCAASPICQLDLKLIGARRKTLGAPVEDGLLA